MIADSTWGDLGVGSFVQGSDLSLWRVDNLAPSAPGWQWYLLTARDGQQHRLQQQLTTPCKAYVLSRIEAQALLSKVLGATDFTETENGVTTTHDLPPLDYAAREWGLMEAKAAQQVLAARWERPHIPTTGPGALARLRSHLTIMHGYPRPQDFASAKQAAEAHDWMHEHPDYLIPHPHHHAEAPPAPVLPDWIKT